MTAQHYSLHILRAYLEGFKPLSQDQFYRLVQRLHHKSTI